MAKTEDQIFLERLGVFEDTRTNDSDFERDSAVVDELEQERERLDALQLELEAKERELNMRETELSNLLQENRSERKRLDKWHRELEEFEADLEMRSVDKSVADGATVMDDGAIDEYRKKKKAEKLIKIKESKPDEDMVRSVWSTTGWNT